ncbi:hypothetical protein NE237_028625 [Protea cynaroides]|uniref:Uncharacterized protein n=1 Tax=Protea cynaroides TaxID=273540 RepID=A0A9Q0GQ87_9MAGN|nr:hypothetical protein NE237_028625 [Protea cynaroides]
MVYTIMSSMEWIAKLLGVVLFSGCRLLYQSLWLLNIHLHRLHSQEESFNGNGTKELLLIGKISEVACAVSKDLCQRDIQVWLVGDEEVLRDEVQKLAAKASSECVACSGNCAFLGTWKDGMHTNVGIPCLTLRKPDLLPFIVDSFPWSPIDLEVKWKMLTCVKRVQCKLRGCGKRLLE